MPDLGLSNGPSLAKRSVSLISAAIAKAVAAVAATAAIVAGSFPAGCPPNLTGYPRTCAASFCFLMPCAEMVALTIRACASVRSRDVLPSIQASASAVRQ
jgi:hypothetical protein